MHYYRKRRTGTYDDPPPLRFIVCVVEDCTSGEAKPPRQEDGLCRMHVARLNRRGDLAFEYKGTNNNRYLGDDVGYAGLHIRLRRTRGPARLQTCASCASPAAQWAYDHSDPNESLGDDGLPYSTDLARYRPLCVQCHVDFDAACARNRWTDEGRAHPNAALAPDQVLEIRRRVVTEKPGILAREFGVTPGYIGAIRRRTAWAHL
jgi:hypothetical protein